MNNDDDDLLAGIDLHAWQVPPPRAEDRPPILVRGLAPPPAISRKRLVWTVAALAVVNALIAALIVIILVPAREPAVTVQAPGGGALDSQVRVVLQRLELQRKELELKIAEIDEMRVLIQELSERLRRYEDRTIPRDTRTRDTAPAPTPTPAPAPTPPRDTPAEPPNKNVDHASCDEVSCVLNNYAGRCCDKYRKGEEALSRTSISAGISRVKPQITACGSRGTGKIKARVNVAPSGRVTSVSIDGPKNDNGLGACVAAVLRKAWFDETHHGGSFTYPFVF